MIFLKLLDLHTHVLPGLDDGADSLETALGMLRNAAASHVLALAATPHCNNPHFAGNYYDENLLASLRALRLAAEQAEIPVKILAGMEVRVNDDLPPLLTGGKVLTLNGSRYLLTEFAPDAPASYCEKMLRLILSHGLVPLIAHPERYATVWQNPEQTRCWLDLGCHLQLTGGSILGKFGKDAWKASDYLIRNDLVACVASDAHGLHYRTNRLNHVYDHLALHTSPAYAQMLLWENPLRICGNEDL